MPALYLSTDVIWPYKNLSTLKFMFHHQWMVSDTAEMRFSIWMSKDDTSDIRKAFLTRLASRCNVPA